MGKKDLLAEIRIRNELRPGDIGYVIYLHGNLYGREYNYGIEFETYVAEGLCEFYGKHNTKKESYLWTTHELTAAAHLYKRAGFRLTEEKDSTAFGKPLKEQRYGLVLP